MIFKVLYYHRMVWVERVYLLSILSVFLKVTARLETQFPKYYTADLGMKEKILTMFSKITIKYLLLLWRQEFTDQEHLSIQVGHRMIPQVIPFHFVNNK